MPDYSRPPCVTLCFGGSGFCHWVFEAAKRGPGKKIILIDELWRWVDAHSLPAELGRITCMGRAEGLELFTATQHPRDYHRDLRAELVGNVF